MENLFLDESGETCFKETSDYKHFLITIVYVNNSDGNKIKSYLKRCFVENFYNKGWNKNEELKAVSVYKNEKYGSDGIIKVIESLVKINSLQINYIIVNKTNIKSQNLKDASYGIAYNYFTGHLLEDLIFNGKLHKVNLIYDKRNKETHKNMPFQEYLKTHILRLSVEKDLDITLLFDGKDSRDCFGLKAADFLSWSIYRRFELKDDRFFKLIANKIGKKHEWYI